MKNGDKLSLDQQQLVVQYLPLAQKIAYQRKQIIPNYVDIDELISAAYQGLVSAAFRFNPEKASFVTYAYIRINGAIGDYLRELQWLPELSLDSANEDGGTVGASIPARAEDDHAEFFEEVRIRVGNQAETIMRSYFIDELSMKEIGKRYGVSESRISQLISSYKDQIQRFYFEAAA